MNKLKNLYSLVGLNRSNDKIKVYLEDDKSVPEITIEKDDGIHYEYIYFLEEGISLTFNFNELTQITFWSKNNVDHFHEYTEELPENLQFTFSEKEVTESLKDPYKSGGDMQSGLFGYVNKWVEYTYETHNLHITFNKEKTSIIHINIKPKSEST